VPSNVSGALVSQFPGLPQLDRPCPMEKQGKLQKVELKKRISTRRMLRYRHFSSQRRIQHTGFNRPEPPCESLEFAGRGEPRRILTLYKLLSSHFSLSSQLTSGWNQGQGITAPNRTLKVAFVNPRRSRWA
jgi:hypothetical protein